VESVEKRVKSVVQGSPAIDGAGVKLTRVLGPRTIRSFDPFLLLDSFDSQNPDDYSAGFPMHPHRGIETITYLISGTIEHRDSLGNRGFIRDGATQWMTAGSGILHQEMPLPSPRMLGVQLWLNLPQKEKMADPRYFDISPDLVKEVDDGNSTVRIISGVYQHTLGITPHHLPATILDIRLRKASSITVPCEEGQTVFVFTLEGNVKVGETLYREKSALLFGEGDFVRLSSETEREGRLLFVEASPLREPVAWGGPIVMNSQAELDVAFSELERGTFIQTR